MSEVEIKKEEVVTFTVKLSKERAKHIEEWLTWAYYMWAQFGKDPQKYSEFLSGMDPVVLEWMPELKGLNYNTLMMLRSGLRK